MPTSSATIDFILDQIEDIPDIYTRKMFGEYALYLNKKVVALVCDNQVFVKNTKEGKSLLGELYEEGRPFPGAKPWILIGEEVIENRELFSDVLKVTAEVLLMPKKENIKTKKSPR